MVQRPAGGGDGPSRPVPHCQLLPDFQTSGAVVGVPSVCHLFNYLLTTFLYIDLNELKLKSSFVLSNAVCKIWGSWAAYIFPNVSENEYRTVNVKSDSLGAR